MYLQYHVDIWLGPSIATDSCRRSVPEDSIDFWNVFTRRRWMSPGYAASSIGCSQPECHNLPSSYEALQPTALIAAWQNS